MKLTVRLSKADKAIPVLLKADHGLSGPVNNWAGIQGAALYYGTAYMHPPEWMDFVRSGAAAAQIPTLNSEGAVAIIFIPVQNRWAVYSFGHTASKLCIAPLKG